MYVFSDFFCVERGGVVKDCHFPPLTWTSGKLFSGPMLVMVTWSLWGHVTNLFIRIFIYYLTGQVTVSWGWWRYLYWNP